MCPDFDNFNSFRRDFSKIRLNFGQIVTTSIGVGSIWSKRGLHYETLRRPRFGLRIEQRSACRHVHARRLL